MCGVFGWFSFGRALSDCEIEAATRATTTLSHRGPDNQGIWRSPNVFLGHRRLTIIDLSEAANQPFEYNGGILIFNGEIYNYLELRETLEGFGHSFRTSSDTEVLAAAILQWDIDAFRRLDGMFAGAWHDPKRGRSIIFRDALGQKPLYWHSSAKGLLFASELRALISLPGMNWRIDREAFQRYVANAYYGWTETPIVSIRKLPPGCVAVVENSQVKVERYWHSTPGEQPRSIASKSEALDTLEHLLRISCARALRSDVPYGVFLSGGIDSALVLDFCKEANPDVHAYSVAMAEPDFDESAKALAVARHLGIAEHELFTLGESEIVECYRTVLQLADEPHGDPGIINSYFLARSVRKRITVGIAGDGGDELFAGYPPFRAIGISRWLKHAPSVAIAGLKKAATLLPNSDGYLGLKFKVTALLQGFPSNDSMRLPSWLACEAPNALQHVFKDEIHSGPCQGAAAALFNVYREVLEQTMDRSDVQQCLQFYQQVFLPEFVCMHTDRAAMLQSLEVRSPMLSPDLITFANRLPDGYKARGSTLKWLLRELASRRGHPPRIVKQSKQGFTFPLARWMKGSLRSTVEDLLFDPGWADDDLVRPAQTRQRFDRHMAGTDNNYRILHNLAVFRAWRRSFPQVTT
jgi:asparagine synthase (glutamine-hydrolysing)